MTFDQNKVLQKAQSMAETFDAQETEAFAKKHTDKAWYADFMLLYEMITDLNYEVDTSTYLAITGALAYVVFPIDLIPDFIIGAGFLDDAFVVGVVMKRIADEIEKFKNYRGGYNV